MAECNAFVSVLWFVVNPPGIGCFELFCLVLQFKFDTTLGLNNVMTLVFSKKTLQDQLQQESTRFSLLMRLQAEFQISA